MKINRVTTAIIFLLITISIFLNACDTKPKISALPAASQVLALGDSLTAGAGVRPEQAWTSLLADKTGWVVINGGINGDTSAAALQRLPDLLEQYHPELVLVTLGGNDMLRQVPPQQTVANLQQILSQIKSHGAQAILLATPNPSLMGAVFQNLSAPDFYRTLAEAQQIPLVEDAIADVLSEPHLKGDPLHPNAAGHQRLADKIHSELKLMGYTD